MIAAVAVMSEGVRDSYPPLVIAVPLALIAWAVWGVIVWREKKGLQK